MLLRRIAFTAVASFAALSAGPAVAQEGAPAPRLPHAGQDHLTVTVSGAGAEDGTYRLECGSDGSFGGTHPRAEAACERLGEHAAAGEDPFAPVSADALCTMQQGGPETAHVTGVWHGRPVEASYDRNGGCEISRWNAMVPVLPGTGAGGPVGAQ